MTLRRVTRLCVAVVVVWACSCGVRGPVPWFVTQQAQAGQGLQAYADALCSGLNMAYGEATKGYRITFKHCRYASRDQSGLLFFWVWFKVVHQHRVTLNLAKVDATGQLAEGPYKLSPYEYDHDRLPGPAA